MAVRIGHASISENGTVNGAKGDQTHKEVCIRSYYSKGWNVVLRCTDTLKAELMARACESGCANDNIGYSQNDRNSLNTQAKKVGYDLSKVVEKCNTDCSAFMSVCAQCALVPIPYHSGNAPTTSTMTIDFVQTGEFIALTDSKYLTSDKYLKRGDILVKKGSHTVMVLDDGSSADSSVQTVTTLVSNFTVKQTYRVGATYTLNANLFVRNEPKGTPKKLSELTADGQKHSYDDGNGKAIMKKGTRVTCKELKVVGNQTWMRTPSGWLCGIDGSKKNII